MSVHCSRGTSFMRSGSIFTGSVCRVRPSRPLVFVALMDALFGLPLAFLAAAGFLALRCGAVPDAGGSYPLRCTFSQACSSALSRARV